MIRHDGSKHIYPMDIVCVCVESVKTSAHLQRGSLHNTKERTENPLEMWMNCVFTCEKRGRIFTSVYSRNRTKHEMDRREDHRRDFNPRSINLGVLRINESRA